MFNLLNLFRRSRGASGAEAGYLISLVAVLAIGAVSISGGEIARLMNVGANVVSDAALPGDKTRPNLSISGGSADEDGDITFTITADEAVNESIAVSLAVTGSSATAGDDFTVPASATIPNGATSIEVVASGIDDNLYEGGESFTLEMTKASRGTIATASAEGSITDNEAYPQLSISASPTSASEGTNPTFTTTMTTPSATGVTVDFATRNGSAAAGSDYVAKSGTFTFAPGETSKSTDVSVYNDGSVEGNESFYMDLSNSDGAVISDGTAGFTIVNNDSYANCGNRTVSWQGSDRCSSETFSRYSGTLSHGSTKLLDGFIRRGRVTYDSRALFKCTNGNWSRVTSYTPTCSVDDQSH